MPATVGELLSLADGEVQAFTDDLLQGQPVRLAPVLRAWRVYESRCRGGLAVALGPRAPTFPVDAAVAAWIGRSRATPAPHMASTMTEERLLRAAAFTGAAGDLLAQMDAPAGEAHAVAARIASTAASAAYTLVVAGGLQAHTPSHDLAPVVVTQAAASRVVDAHASTGRGSALPHVTAEPTSITYSPGSRLSAAALRLQRECVAADPCSEVFILGSVSASRLMITSWQVLSAAQQAGLISAPLDGVREELRQAALAWRHVSQDWRAHIVPGRRPESLRAAAAEFSSACDEVVLPQTPQPAYVLRTAVAGVSRSIAHVVRLHQPYVDLTRQLVATGLVFVPARSLPPHLDRLEAALAGRYAPAPVPMCDHLAPNVATALRLTRSSHGALQDIGLEAVTCSRSNPSRAERKRVTPPPPGRDLRNWKEGR